MAEGIRDDEGAIQGRVGDLEMGSCKGTETLVKEASGRVSARNVSGEYDDLPNPQIVVQQLIGTWIVPIVIGLMVCLIVVVVENQSITPNEKLLLRLCFGASIVAIFLGVVLLILSIMRWKNPKKDFVIVLIFAVAFGSSIVSMSSLMIFWVSGFSNMQS